MDTKEINIEEGPILSILALMGGIASGKSTLSNKIKSELLNENLSVIILAFDEFVPLDIQSKSLTKFKILRSNFVKCVQYLSERLITPLQEVDLKDQLSIEADDLIKAEEFVEKTQNILQSIFTSTTDKYLFVIDDNNYYHSMRNDYYQISKNFGLGFSIIYINSDLKNCLKRNSERNENLKISEEIIKSMNDKFEEPNPIENICDTFCFQIDNNTENGMEDINILIIRAIVEYSFKNSIIPPKDRTEEIARERRLCSESEIHQADLMLRKWVNTQLTLKSFGESKNKMKEISQEYSLKKTLVLNKLRSGELKILSDLKEDEFHFREEIINFAKNVS